MPPEKPVRPLLTVAVLISGSGTTLRNLIEKSRVGQPNIDIGLVISSNPIATGLQYAVEASIPQQVVQRSQFKSTKDFSAVIFRLCRKANVELVVMGGFLQHLLIPDDFELRVMNIHPALVPSFCGKGFYGHHVHQAVIDRGVKVSGCTVHFVDNYYDHGPIILQRIVPVLDNDTAKTLAARVFEQECEAYPEAVRLYAADKLHVDSGRVFIVSR